MEYGLWQQQLGFYYAENFEKVCIITPTTVFCEFIVAKAAVSTQKAQLYRIVISLVT